MILRWFILLFLFGISKTQGSRLLVLRDDSSIHQESTYEQISFEIIQTNLMYAHYHNKIRVSVIPIHYAQELLQKTIEAIERQIPLIYVAFPADPHSLFLRRWYSRPNVGYLREKIKLSSEEQHVIDQTGILHLGRGDDCEDEVGISWSQYKQTVVDPGLAHFVQRNVNSLMVVLHDHQRIEMTETNFWELGRAVRQWSFQTHFKPLLVVQEERMTSDAMTSFLFGLTDLEL